MSYRSNLSYNFHDFALWINIELIAWTVNVDHYSSILCEGKMNMYVCVCVTAQLV